MTKLRLNITMSLDGYVAGPSQSVAHPLGEGGEQRTRSFRAVHGMEGGATGADDDIAAEYFHNVGATIMGRHMFRGGDGPWGDNPWDGWWGENPPFHMPVFVLTHHAREPFHFVTEGISRGASASAGGSTG
jgi:dihydrofolate reductase